MLFHKKEQTKEERKEAAPILEVRDLYYAYNDEKHALNGVSLQIREGEKIAVLGANGAGKSTFFLSINGVLRPHSDYTIPGTEVTHRVVTVEKVRPTPKGYPRRWTKIQKSPLVNRG